MTNPIQQFEDEVKQNIAGLAADLDVQALSRIWIREIARHKYAYNFSWMGRPAIQFPQDMIAVQEIIWKVKPDLIIETGIAHGGSLVHSASQLQLLGGEGKVVGIDVDIREHNRKAIEQHPMFHRIEMIEGSSIDSKVVEQVKQFVDQSQTVLVLLDSNHTHDHVLQELKMYSQFVTSGSYLVAFDTLIEDLPAELCGDRPWGPGNNPKTAVWEFLKTNDQFEIDEDITNKLLITAAPDGWLRRK